MNTVSVRRGFIILVLGYTVGNSFAIGAEYEYEDYSTMRFNYPEGDAMFLKIIRLIC